MSESNAMPWRLVVAGCIGFFAATATGSTRAPFLPDMAADLNVSLPAVANLFGVTAAAWGISSWLAGYASDRIGRHVFLLSAPLCIALAMLAVAHAQTYPVLVVIIILAGASCGAFTTTTLAEVATRVHSSLHGRAFGYVMTGQSLTLLFGIPLAAWLGASTGWRGMHIALAGLAVFAFALMVFGLHTPNRTAPAQRSVNQPRALLSEALTGPVVRLFIALIAERVAFGLAAFYYASYLRSAYNLPVDAVALPLAVFALGNIAGTFTGGQVADRFPYRRVSFAVALASAGCLAVPWFLWQPGLAGTMILGILFAFCNAIARPPLLAALAEVPADVRGAVMGLNSSIASIGWLLAALTGGWLYTGAGYAGFSVLMAAMCVCGALIVLPDSRIRQRQTA